MITVGLFQTLSQFHTISDSFEEAINRELTHLSLPKHHFLLEAPRISDHVFFINNGFATSYTYYQGRKQIEQFWPPSSIIISVKSFMEQVPSHEFIQLEADSDVLYMSYASVMQLFHTFPEANYIFRMVMSLYFDSCCERVRDLKHLTAFARYTKLKKTFASIEQHVSQEYIASYLGIAAPSLSRIKRTQRKL